MDQDPKKIINLNKKAEANNITRESVIEALNIEYGENILRIDNTFHRIKDISKYWLDTSRDSGITLYRVSIVTDGHQCVINTDNAGVAHHLMGIISSVISDNARLRR